MYTTAAMDKLTNHLTDKEKSFCEHYCNLGYTAVEAIYASGYKPKNRNTAYSMASENLRKPKIRTYISEIYRNFKFVDEEVMHELWYLIKQHHDLPSKARAIDIYFKKRGGYIQDKPENTIQTVNIIDYAGGVKSEPVSKILSVKPFS